jgi:hypothetical protein
VSATDIVSIIGTLAASVAAAAGLVWRAQRADAESLRAALADAQKAREGYHSEEIKRVREDAAAQAATLREVTSALQRATDLFERVEARLDALDATGRFNDADVTGSGSKRRTR